MSALSNPSRLFLLAPFVGLSLFWSESVSAETTEALPSYVIEEFGAPPAIPDGPISANLKAAVQSTFVDSFTQSRWGSEQTAALAEIAASNDPRLAWLISDMMRFPSNGGLTLVLSEAAADSAGEPRIFAASAPSS